MPTSARTAEQRTQQRATSQNRQQSRAHILIVIVGACKFALGDSLLLGVQQRWWPVCNICFYYDDDGIGGDVADDDERYDYVCMCLVASRWGRT